MTAHHSIKKLTTTHEKSLRPLKLITSVSPKTSVFEKQLGLINSGNGTFIFTTHKSPGRKIGGYNPPTPTSLSPSPRISLPPSPQKFNSRSPMRDVNETQLQIRESSNEVCVKIPLHRIRTTFRSISGFFESLTKDDFDLVAEYLSYSSVGGFAVFGEAVLQANKQGFLILVPIVLVSVLKIVLNSGENILVAGSIDQTLSRKNVSPLAQKMVCKVVIFLKTLLLLLAAKTTASFKQNLDFSSHLEVTILLMLGSLIIGVFVSLFQNVVSISSIRDHSLNFEESPLLSPAPLDHDLSLAVSSQLRNDLPSPTYDDYCMLDTPESMI